MLALAYPTVRGGVSVSWRNEDTNVVTTEFHEPSFPMEDILMVMERQRRRRRGSREQQDSSNRKPERTAKAGLRELIGDGKAAVTIPMDVGEKDFGNGFGAGMSVTLTCDQSEEGIDRAAEAAAGLIEHYLPGMADRAYSIFKEGADKRKLRKGGH